MHVQDFIVLYCQSVEREAEVRYGNITRYTITFTQGLPICPFFKDQRRSTYPRDVFIANWLIVLLDQSDLITLQ